MIATDKPTSATTDAGETSSATLDYAPVKPSELAQPLRVFLTLADQGLVSVANVGTSILLGRYFANDKDHFAHYTLAFNLMIWIGELHSSTVYTPHTMLSPLKSGDELRRFHGSTLLHHLILSFAAMCGLLILAPLCRGSDIELSQSITALGLGTIFIGLRNYLRPYQFTARRPDIAFMVDLAVCVLQIGGIVILSSLHRLTSSSALLVLGAASGLPAITWLVCNHSKFSISWSNTKINFLEHWPNTRWILVSSLIWNAGMLLYPWLIKWRNGTPEVAVWGYCYQLAAIGNPMLMGLQSFVGPRIAEAYAERSSKLFSTSVYRLGTLTMLMMLLPAILLSIFSGPLIHLITKGQMQGQSITIIAISAAIVLQGGTFALSRGLFALQRGDLDLYANFGPLIVMFLLGIPMVSYFGAEGAALSLLAAQVMSNSMRAILFARAVKQPPHPHLNVPDAPLEAQAAHELQ